MDRRKFLLYGIGIGAAGASWYALSRFGMNGQPMDMGGQGHQMASGTMGGMGNMQGTGKLMPSEMMPSGQPLKDLPRLANASSQAGVFQAAITAAPVKITMAGGKETEFWAYNGQLPGPQIEVYEGDTVEITVTNRLPQPTTVHWHGLDVPNDADGNPQDPIEPGQSKTYRFTLPEGSAGTYWYHPHPHNYVSEQVYKGLAGTLIVKAKNDVLAHSEQHWLISNLRLNEDGSIPPNTMLDWMNGREGEFVLINGQYRPKIKLSGNERLRIWNATSARYLRLKIKGVQWIVVGTDGGLLEKPLAPADELFLAPAERVEVFAVGQEQTTAELTSLYYDRRKMMVQEKAADLNLGEVQFTPADAALPAALRTLPALPAPVVKREVVFSEQMKPMQNTQSQGGMQGMDHGAMAGEMAGAMQNTIPQDMVGVFLVNGKTFDMKRVDFVGNEGDVEEWTLANQSHMDHPFHLHGTQFEVLQTSLNGNTAPAPYRARKDTVNLRPGETAVIRFIQGNKGLKMFHCHILEHENLGMMAMLQVK